MSTGPHITFSAEPLLSISGFDLTNSGLTSLIVSVILILMAVIIRSQLKDSSKPTGLQNFAEWVIESLQNLVHSVTGDYQRTRLFFPLIASFFLFILLNNWIGVWPGIGTITAIYQIEPTTGQANLPGWQPSQSQVWAATNSDKDQEPPAVPTGTNLTSPDNSSDSDQHQSQLKSVPIFRPGTADINMTLALALISILATQFFGLKYLKLGYLQKFFNFSNPIMFFVGILELISEFAKIVSFAFRLFGNVFAGEVLLSVIAFIGGSWLFLAPLPFYGLEIFVGFIQALVFAMLSLVFFNMATVGHHDH